MADFSEILEWIESREKFMTSLVQEWAHQNSGSTNIEGVNRMGEVVSKAFSVLDAEHQVYQPEPMEIVTDAGKIEKRPLAHIHHFKKRPGANRRILLTGHLDTVFPKDHAFQTCRMLDDNRLNGPGVADMKGGLIVMLTALQALEESEYADSLGYEILLSPDEEIGSPGSAPYLKDRAQHADFGMTYEPALADGTLAGARKGSGNFSIIVKGRAAHAGREFDEGRNAVVHLSRLLADIFDLNGQREGVTLNPAVISGGTAPNIVPDVAVARLNIRVPAVDDQEWVSAKLLGLIRTYDKEEGFEATLHGGFSRPPKVLTAENKALFRQLKVCGDMIDVPVEWRATGGCCEGNNLAAAGLPNIDTLGVRGAFIHSSDEYVCLDSFVERAKLSALLMLRYATGDFTLKE